MVHILNALEQSGRTVVFPVHPRTRKYLQEYGLWDRIPNGIICTEPLGYLDMIRLMADAGKVITDSWGIQKEAYIMGVPCITLRENTEWVETVDECWNVLAGVDEEKILTGIWKSSPKSPLRGAFGSPGASRRIVDFLHEDIQNAGSSKP
jgi:UDP-GlcNAc3NAcA epimerase